jgi:SAM-dependent methyltransferase
MRWLEIVRGRIANLSWKGWRYESFVRRHRLDLGFASVERLGLVRGRSTGHSNSGGPALDTVLKTLPIKNSDLVVDIGCGKGGAMITLSKYPFAHIDGLDISSEMIQIAEKNLRSLGISNSRLFRADASSFRDLDEYTYIYMFNPFCCEVMRNVIANIVASLDAHPRELTIIYSSPMCHDVLLSSGRFVKVAEFDQVRNMPIWVYKSRGEE